MRPLSLAVASLAALVVSTQVAFADMPCARTEGSGHNLLSMLVNILAPVLTVGMVTFAAKRWKR